MKEITRLKEIERRYKALVQDTSLILLLINSEGKILDVNPTALEIYGYKEDDFLDKNYKELDLIPKNKRDSFQILFEDAFKKGSVKPMEFEILSKDGGYYWLSLEGSVVNIRQEPCLQLILQDINERKMAEMRLIEIQNILQDFSSTLEHKIVEKSKELVKSEEKYRALMQSSPNSILLVNRQGIIEDCNDTASIYIGLPKDQIIGRNILNIYSIKHREDAPDKMKIGEIYFPIEFEFTNHKGAKKVLSSNFSMIQLGDEIYTQIVSQEISARKEAEEVIKRELSRLKELDKMKSEFVYRASHELKTPLNSLNVASRTLLNYFHEDLDENISKLLTIIRNNGERLKHLVEDLLDVARIESQKMKITKKQENLTELIKQCGEDMSYFLQKRALSIHWDIAEDLFVQVDKVRFEQVILNLLSNAIKNTPPKGKITITAKETGNFIEIKVSDTGVGITEEEQKLLFKKFGKIER
ncbi:MAG: PAS domain-containing sensor histidine kinase, partial [Promethearchaeota archaeon]